MEIPSLVGLLAIVGLVLANGFFVATEFAIVAVRHSRIEQLAEAGRSDAVAAREVIGHLDTYIAACQLGITMSSLALGWIGEPALARLIEPPLEAIAGRFAPTAADGVAIGIAFALITAVHIVIGELAPKGVALQRTERVALWVARPIRLFYVVFRWPVQTLNAVGNAVLRLFGLEPASGHEAVHSVEELGMLVRGMEQAGVVEASEARIASRAFRLADLTAGALMTPRTEIVAMPLTSTLDDLLAQVQCSPHSRIPIYDGSLDQIVGVLHLRDLLMLLDQPRTAFDLRRLVRSVLLVPTSKRADDLLEEMQAARSYMAVVLDEFGGTAGIITLEDLVESLVGRIEHEPIGASAPVVTAGALGHAAEEEAPLLPGLLRLEEFEELTGVQIPREAHREVETLGGLVMLTLGRVAEVGDEVTLGDHLLRVERLDGRRVDALRLLPVQSATR